MSKRKTRIIPNILYHLTLTWQDRQRKTHVSPLYVGNDDPLSLTQLEKVGYLWLAEGIEKRACTLLGVRLQQTIRP